jgi:predicted permease
VWFDPRERRLNVSWLSRLFELRKDELDEEIRAHLALDVAYRMSRGDSRLQAEAAAAKEFGNAALVRDVTHGFWRWRRLERFAADLRYALRVLRRSSGFSITVIATLAVGVGAACAMFTVVDGVLLRPLPFKDPGSLVQIRESGKRGPLGSGSPYLDIEQWRERSHAFSQIAYYRNDTRRASFLEGTAGTMHVGSASVSANLFDLLGVHPVLGRGFWPRDAGDSVTPGDEHSLLLSDAVWRTNYSGDHEIVGKTVELNGEHFRVLGVMPRGFTFPYTGSNSNGMPLVWKPLVLKDADASRSHNGAPSYIALGRLRGGFTLAAAEAELKVFQPDVVKSYTDAADREDAYSISLQSYTESLVHGDMRKALFALMGASALLWLIACLNVTSLMWARATTRRRELAVRSALGASRWQIVEYLLIEGVLLSGFASLLGLGLAAGILKLFEREIETQFSIHQSLTPNLPVLGALLALTIAGALLISAWPAIGAARASIDATLRQGSPQQGVGSSHARMRVMLVVAEIAISLTLLVGCGLLLRTIYALKHVPLGFRTEHIVVANMTIPAYKFAGRDMTTALYQPLVDRVKRLPGVESATLLTDVPLGKTFQMIFTFAPEGNSADAIRRRAMQAQFRAVGPEMQQVFGFQMLRGRFFNEGDTPASQAVVVVNRAFVKAYFGDDRDPGKILGESLIGFGKSRRSVVVGVLDDERQVSVAESSQPEMEVCIPQITPESMFYKAAEGMSMDLAVRTQQSPSLVTPELREALRAASSDLAASTFSTMEQVVEDSFGSQNLAAHLLEIFGGSALLLCLAGVYGLLSYLVAQRRQEIGLRIALGAQQWNVMSLVLRQAGWMLISWLAIGLGMAYLGAMGLRTLLYGVKAGDPWTICVVTLAMLLGGLAASLLPALRAARVDPMEALRTE